MEDVKTVDKLKISLNQKWNHCNRSHHKNKTNKKKNEERRVVSRNYRQKTTLILLNTLHHKQSFCQLWTLPNSEPTVSGLFTWKCGSKTKPQVDKGSTVSAALECQLCCIYTVKYRSFYVHTKDNVLPQFCMFSDQDHVSPMDSRVADGVNGDCW